MLFHVTATHTANNCPGYNRELMPPMLDAIEASGDLATELGIKVLFMVSAAPKHVSYILLETEDSTRIALWVNSFPYKQDFDINPVMHEEKMAAMAREMMSDPNWTYHAALELKKDSPHDVLPDSYAFYLARRDTIV